MSVGPNLTITAEQRLADLETAVYGGPSPAGGAATQEVLLNPAGNALQTIAGPLAATLFQGPVQTSVEVEAASGAIGIKAGAAVITKSSAAAVMTLAAPTAATDDGKVLRVVSTTAQAHTVTTPANKLNGNKLTATFGGAVGDCLDLIAYNGVWYVLPSTNITLS